MTNETTTTSIRQDEEFSVAKNGEEIGKLYPWVLTLNAGSDGEYTMEFRSLDDASEAAKSWHG